MQVFVLELRNDAGVLAKLGLRSDPIHVGRAPTNDLVLEDPSISARHLAAWASGGRAWVEDLHSRNGSEVSGRPVHGVVEVQGGDEVRLGSGVILRVASG